MSSKGHTYRPSPEGSGTGGGTNSAQWGDVRVREPIGEDRGSG